MWHVGVHIWEVPPNEIEPNYDEYYAVSSFANRNVLITLIELGGDGFQSSKHPHITTRQVIDHSPSPPRRFSHRMAKASPIRHPRLHRRERSNTMVPLHLHLSANDWKHLEAADIWRTALHGPP